ncbi:MAG: polyketide synthase dehydratase domain-containing protein, partial [Pirellulales bacterium]|nr:polyketide synthase dehydratase domain-containing protein [Pirellulales bacterium]
EATKRNADFLREYVENGKLGVKSECGFYDYPQPQYRQPSFLSTADPKIFTENVRKPWPIIKSVWSVPSGVNEVTIRIDPQKCAFVRDHRFKGSPLLPVSATIEIMRYAVEQMRPNAKAVGIRSLSIENGLRFFTDRPATLSLTLHPIGDAWQAALYHDYYNRAGKLVQAGRWLASAWLTVETEPMSARPQPLLDGSVFDVGYPAEGPLTEFGPTMQCLKRVVLGDGIGEAEIRCNPLGDSSETEYDTAVAAFDAALVSCIAYAQKQNPETTQLASRADSIVVGRRPVPGEECRVHLTCEELGDRRNVFNLVLSGADGSRLLSLQGYECTVLPSRDAATLELTQPTESRASTHV